MSAHQQQQAQQMRTLKTEMKLLSDLTKRMQNQCFAKCIAGTKSRDSELTVGEMTCVDRCVVKYMDTHEAVGESFKKLQEQAAAAMGGPAPGQ